MINYNRLGYEIKGDFVNFSEKICKGLARPKCKFVTQILYGILAGNKVHLSEIAHSLNESIPLKKQSGGFQGTFLPLKKKKL